MRTFVVVPLPAGPQGDKVGLSVVCSTICHFDLPLKCTSSASQSSPPPLISHPLSINSDRRRNCQKKVGFFPNPC